MKPTVGHPHPAHGAGAVHGRRIDTYIIAGDESLLLELGPALDDDYRTRPVEYPEGLPADTRAPWIGFVDGARADARAVIQRIGESHPEAILIAIVDDADLRNWQGLVFRGSVCAAIGTRQIGTAAFADALSRARTLMHQASVAALLASSARPRATRAGTDRVAWRITRQLPVLIGVALMVLALGWWLAATARGGSDGLARSQPQAGARTGLVGSGEGVEGRQ